jgi:hypothetical protein
MHWAKKREFIHSGSEAPDRQPLPSSYQSTLLNVVARNPEAGPQNTAINVGQFRRIIIVTDQIPDASPNKLFRQYCLLECDEAHGRFGGVYCLHLRCISERGFLRAVHATRVSLLDQLLDSVLDPEELPPKRQRTSTGKLHSSGLPAAVRTFLLHLDNNE